MYFDDDMGRIFELDVHKGRIEPSYMAMDGSSTFHRIILEEEST